MNLQLNNRLRGLLRRLKRLLLNRKTWYLLILILRLLRRLEEISKVDE